MANVSMNTLVKIALLMFKKLLVQGVRRRRLLHQQRKVCHARLLRLHRIRYVYSRLAQERMLYMKLLTAWVQANGLRKRNQRYPSSWWEKTVKEKFTVVHWQRYFRMSKETFLDIVENIKMDLPKEYEKCPISHDKQVAVTLLLLSRAKSFKSLSFQFGIQEGRIAEIVKNVCEAIVKILMPQYIKMPTEKNLSDYIVNFEKKWGFPQCGGVLSSIHVPIHSVEFSENAADYMNSDGGYSMFLQGIVDPHYKFWDVNIGWPGNVSESRVLTSSALWLKGQEGKLFPSWTKVMGTTEVPVFILAGSSYPLAEWILKPYQCKDSAPADKQKFNDKFSFAYNACEIAFKRLKARWNCLVVGSTCNVAIFPSVAAACCTLHNICETYKEPMSDVWIVKAENSYHQPLPSQCNSVTGTEAESIREAVKNYFQSQEN